MATLTLLPDGVTATNEWQNHVFGGTAAHTNVISDNESTYRFQTAE